MCCSLYRILYKNVAEMRHRAGAMLLFDEGGTTLLGLEFIQRFNKPMWVGPAGKLEPARHSSSSVEGM